MLGPGDDCIIYVTKDILINYSHVQFDFGKYPLHKNQTRLEEVSEDFKELHLKCTSGIYDVENSPSLTSIEGDIEDSESVTSIEEHFEDDIEEPQKDVNNPESEDG